MRTSQINVEAMVKVYRRGCMTNTTLRSIGQRELDREDTSIHPTKTHFNTSKPAKLDAKGNAKGKLGKAQRKLAARRADYMNTLLSTREIAEGSYHQPGSMNLG